MTAKVDAFTGLKPGPFTTKTVKEIFLPGTVPTQKDDDPRRRSRSTRRPACSGRTAAPGPMVTKGFFDCREVEAGFPAWQKADAELGGARGARARASRAARRAPGRRTSTTAAFAPFGRIVGRAVRARRSSARIAPPPPATVVRSRRRSRATPTPPASRADRRRRPGRRRRSRSRRRRPSPDAGRADRRGAQSSTIVAPSPPSPRSPARTRLHQRMRPRPARRTASRRAPVPEAVDDQSPCRGPASDGVVEVARQRVERLVDAGAAQVERRGHGAAPARGAARPRSRRPPVAAVVLVAGRSLGGVRRQRRRPGRRRRR